VPKCGDIRYIVEKLRATRPPTSENMIRKSASKFMVSESSLLVGSNKLEKYGFSAHGLSGFSSG